jgi:transcriptional activator HAC1
VSVSQNAAVASNVPVPPASNVADGLFSADFNMSSASDTDKWGAQNELSPASDPLNYEYHHLASDPSANLPDFDISQFLISDDVSGAVSGALAGHDSIAQDPESVFSLFDFENQLPSETFNQQPHTGASTHGCDDGVLAVGV